MPQPIESRPIQSGENQPTDLAPFTIIRTETVLSKLPIHNLAKKGRVDIQITKKNERGEVDLHWEVSYNDRYGQPRQLAYKLDTLVINRRIDEVGRPLPKIIRLESLKQICESLGLTISGRSKSDVKKAFHQNAGSYIIAKLNYKGRDGTERRLEAGFTRYSVVFTGETLPNKTRADAIYIILNDPYLEVLDNALIRPLDYDYLKVLTPAAQRFYEIISYRIFAAIKYKHSQAKLLYSECCIFSAQQRYDDYDHFKKQMYKIHKPHLQSGYIQKVRYEATTDGEGRPDWMMCYIPGPKAKAEYRVFNRKQLIEDESLQEIGEEASDQEAPPVRDPVAAQAEELVGHFYQLFYGAEKAYPSSKELGQAMDLIAQHGLERARYVVDFSHRAALETDYKPQTFGGVLQYTSRALTTYEGTKSRKQSQEAISHCALCDRDGWIHFEDSHGRGFTAKCPHNVQAIQDYENRKGLRRIT